MGIGVSYTGYDGRTRHAQANSAADLPRIMDAASSGAKEIMSHAQVQSPMMKFDMSNDPVDGPLIGNEGEDSMQVDGMSRPVGSRGGWRIPISRTEETQEWDSQEQAWKIILAKFQFDLIISEKGYVKGRSVERKVWEKEFVAKDASEEGGESNGKYGSRLFYDMDANDPVHPVPTAIAYGYMADLDTYDDRTGKFACNYDDSGNVLPDPPVKVIGTISCTGGVA